MDEIQAGFLRIKLKHLDKDNKKRCEIAKNYLAGMQDCGIILPQTNADSIHVWHLFVIRVKNRKKYQEILSSSGIQTLIHYPVPPHLQKSYKNKFYSKNFNLGLTEKLSNEILSIPLYPNLKELEQDYIIETIRSIKNN